MKLRRHSLASIINKITRMLSGSSTMILPEEQVFIERHIRKKYTDSGAVVELGSFTGGGTRAIAASLQRRGAKHVVHAFDIWEWNSYMDSLMPHISRQYELSPGDSFEQVFDDNTAGFKIIKHKGDLTDQHWDGGPIEFLFVDAAKNKSLALAIARNFFPHCNGTVVQQDFLHDGTAWDKVVMYQLREYFEFVECIGTSAIFTKKGEELDISILDTTPSEDQINEAYDWSLKICGFDSGLHNARKKAISERLDAV